MVSFSLKMDSFTTVVSREKGFELVQLGNVAIVRSCVHRDVSSRSVDIVSRFAKGLSGENTQ